MFVTLGAPVFLQHRRMGHCELSGSPHFPDLGPSTAQSACETRGLRPFGWDTHGGVWKGVCWDPIKGSQVSMFFPMWMNVTSRDYQIFLGFEKIRGKLEEPCTQCESLPGSRWKGKEGEGSFETRHNTVVGKHSSHLCFLWFSG